MSPQFGEPITGADVRAFFKGLFLELFKQTAETKEFKGELQGFLTDVVGWLVYVITSISSVVARPLAEGIIKAFTINRATWAGIMSAFTQELTGVVISTGELTGAAAGEPLLPFLRVFGKELGEQIFDIIAPQDKPTPAMGRTNAEALFALVSKFGLQGWYAHFVAELASLGRIRSAGDLPEAIERSFGLNRITRLVLKPAVTFGIVNPLTEYYNRLYSPKGLSDVLTVEAWQRGLVTDDAALDTLKGSGYDYGNATLLLNVHQKQISPAEAAKMRQTGLIDDAALERIVRHQGYGDERTSLLAQLLREERSTKILDEMAATARRLWHDGKITEQETRALLESAHWTAAEIDLALAHEELALREDKALSVAQLVEAFELQILPAAELRDRLRHRRFTDEDIDVLLALKTKRLTAAQVMEARIRGQLTDTEATGRLAGMGYRAEDIPVLLALRAKVLTAGQAVDALSRGLINVDTARQALSAAGYDPATVDLLLAFQRKTLSVADIQAALLRGLLSEDAARQKLLEAGYTLTDAALLVQLRFRLLTRGEVMDAYDAGLITREGAAGLLQQKGFTPDEAELLLAIADAKKARAVPPVPPAAIPPTGVVDRRVGRVDRRQSVVPLADGVVDRRATHVVARRRTVGLVPRTPT